MLKMTLFLDVTPCSLVDVYHVKLKCVTVQNISVPWEQIANIDKKVYISIIVDVKGNIYIYWLGGRWT